MRFYKSLCRTCHLILSGITFRRKNRYFKRFK